MDFNPLTELGVIQYCILERIGRSRYQGEVTQGKRGLQVVTDDPKMLYYFRKLLVKNKLVTKQVNCKFIHNRFIKTYSEMLSFFWLKISLKFC